MSRYGLYVSGAALLFIMLIGAVVGRSMSSSINQLTARAQRMEEVDLDVEFETARVDQIGRLYGAFANMRDSLRDQIDEAERARAEAQEAQAETERINHHLERKADEYREVMRAAGDGDLQMRMDADSEKEAMREIADEFNAMVDEIERTVDELKAFATEVTTASEQVTASSEEVRHASEQVTESIQEISDSADRQNENLQSVTNQTNDLSTTVEQIAASSNQVATIAEQTAETGRSGRGHLRPIRLHDR